MKSYGQKLDQAYTYLKRKRPSIALNEADAKRTMEAEEGIYGGQASRFQLPIGKQTSSAAGQVVHSSRNKPMQRMVVQMRYILLHLALEILDIMVPRLGARVFKTLPLMEQKFLFKRTLSI